VYVMLNSLFIVFVYFFVVFEVMFSILDFLTVFCGGTFLLLFFLVICVLTECILGVSCIII
jgi:hypothetical protein